MSDSLANLHNTIKIGISWILAIQEILIISCCLTKVVIIRVWTWAILFVTNPTMLLQLLHLHSLFGINFKQGCYKVFDFSGKMLIFWKLKFSLQNLLLNFFIIHTIEGEGTCDQGIKNDSHAVKVDCWVCLSVFSTNDFWRHIFQWSSFASILVIERTL